MTESAVRTVAAAVVVVVAIVGATVYLVTGRQPADTADARVAADLGITAGSGVTTPTASVPATIGAATASGGASGGTIVVPVATVAPAMWARPAELVVVRPGGSQPSTVQATPVGTSDTRRLALTCERVHAAAGRLACFTTGRVRVHDLATQAVLLDRMVNGIPSRVRLSPDGTKVGVTAFEAGHSYQALGEFSTRATIFEVATGSAVDVATLRFEPNETMAKPKDLVAWGVTFRDDDEFYVSLLDAQATTDRRVPTLARGRLSAGTLTPLEPWAECPSIAPDGTTIAFKERVDPGGASGSRYRIVRYDLATGERRPVTSDVSPDDQVLWADGDTLLFTVVDGDALTGRRSTVVRLDLTDGAEAQPVAVDATSPALT